MTKDLVSIITPCYNGEKFISETIESVLRQTYPAWEMLIVDDGSRDRSADIIRSWADKDPRIQYIYQKNAGSAAARNHGIRKADGQYLALLDADDVWCPEFLEEQIQFMKEKHALCVCSAYEHIDGQSRKILRPTYARPVITVRDMKVRNYIGCLTGLYDCSRYGKIYLHEELNSLRDDYAYWYDIVAKTGAAYGNPKVLAQYRVLAGSTTGKKSRLIRVQYRFYRRYLREGPLEAAMNLLRWGFAGIRNFR
jgi:teichuronic acid biosynthesis glycosyltransferase TuaG